MAISAVTLAELLTRPHQVCPNGEQDLYDEHEERARRTEALQRAESRLRRTWHRGGLPRTSRPDGHEPLAGRAP
jgi:hypothetical protein